MNYSNMSDVDVAYAILNESKKTDNIPKPVYYLDLINEVIKRKQKPVQSRSHAIAEIYTLINMDSRFQFRGRDAEGKGLWGLSEWYPAEAKRSHASANEKTVQANDSEAEQEETDQADM